MGRILPLELDFDHLTPARLDEEDANADWTKTTDDSAAALGLRPRKKRPKREDDAPAMTQRGDSERR